MIRGVIEQLERLADGIDQLHHAMEKLCAHAAALRAVVHFELDPFDRALFLNTEPVPPSCEGINEEVTGVGGTTKGHVQLGGVFIEEPTRTIVSVPPKSGSLALYSPRVFPPRENGPSLTVALPSMLNRLTRGVSWLAWSFFEIGKNRISLGDLFLRLRFEDFAQTIAHAV